MNLIVFIYSSCHLTSVIRQLIVNHFAIGICLFELFDVLGRDLGVKTLY